MNYQSTLEDTDVSPTVTTASAGTVKITSVDARVYDFSSFSLRTAAPLPADLKQGIRLDLINGKGQGPICGGTKVVITSLDGGLAWTRVAFGKYYDSKGKLVADQSIAGGGHKEAKDVKNLGVDEYMVDLRSPKYPCPGVVDIAIYLPTDTTKPMYIIKGGFKYTLDLTPLAIALGIGAAIAGLAIGLQPQETGHHGGGGGPCFIATAAYGTPMAADIDTLRTLRDTYLLSNSVGTAFVDTYYRVSPAVANVVAQSPALAAAVRLLLVPVIFLGKLFLAIPAVSALIASALLFAAVVRGRIRRRNRVSADCASQF